MTNRFQTTAFRLSVNQLAQLPADSGREVAFAGRSNAGKSSALNAITGRRQLARVSKTPGRTQMINVFDVGPGARLMDLPGYGYARVPEAVRRHWHGLLQRYFEIRESLAGLILLMDIRHPMTPLDRQMLDWCEVRALPCHILLTKADKLKRGPAMNQLQQLRRTLKTEFAAAPGDFFTAQIFSATTRQGLEEAHAVLDGWLVADHAGAGEEPPEPLP